MPQQDLKEKLISKIRETEEASFLEEIANLFELQEPESLYRLNDVQKKEIAEAREQVRNQQTLTGEQSDKEIDKWLSE